MLIDHNVHSVLAATEIVRVQTLHVLQSHQNLDLVQVHLQEILIQEIQIQSDHVDHAEMENVPDFAITALLSLKINVLAIDHWRIDARMIVVR